MEPVRLVPVRSNKERKERLPRRGVIGPWRGVYGSESYVTRCRPWLHVMPSQWQKEEPVVQFLARKPWGSESWALKSNRAARSVSLPMPVVGLGEEHVRADSRSSKAMEMHADDTIAI